MPSVVQPAKIPEYVTRGAKDPLLPKTPLRGILLAPSGSGKTVLLSSMLLDFYRGAFARIYVFSPSVNIDATWGPVKRYVAEELHVNLEKEPCFFDTWQPEALQAILDEQAAMVKWQKKQGYKKIHGICVVVDDFADDERVVHSNTNVLAMLFLRGRHLMVSTLLSTQKYRALSTMMRANAQFLVVFRLRNRKELEALIEEVSAVYSPEALQRLYNYATDDPFSFLYVDMMAKRREEMFHLRFEKKIVAEE